jgi:Tfp pilus assembly protein PilF
LLQAKAAMLIKRNASAIEKLDRALRIDPQNPTLWHQLAQAHYNQEEDASAISMAKKSNLYVDEGSSLEKQNWQLIKAASKRSENIKNLKAAIQYERAHP